MRYTVLSEVPNKELSYPAVMEMLISIGFKQIAEQYEMVKEIGK